MQIDTDPLVDAPDSEAWWDVPVAEVAALDVDPRRARELRGDKATQKTYLKTPETVRTP